MNNEAQRMVCAFYFVPLFINTPRMLGQGWRLRALYCSLAAHALSCRKYTYLVKEELIRL